MMNKWEEFLFIRSDGNPSYKSTNTNRRFVHSLRKPIRNGGRVLCGLSEFFCNITAQKTDLKKEDIGYIDICTDVIDGEDVDVSHHSIIRRIYITPDAITNGYIHETFRNPYLFKVLPNTVTCIKIVISGESVDLLEATSPVHCVINLRSN